MTGADRFASKPRRSDNSPIASGRLEDAARAAFIFLKRAVNAFFTMPL
jgi:hypothetical protein